MGSIWINQRSSRACRSRNLQICRLLKRSQKNCACNKVFRNIIEKIPLFSINQNVTGKILFINYFNQCNKNAHTHAPTHQHWIWCETFQKKKKKQPEIRKFITRLRKRRESAYRKGTLYYSCIQLYISLFASELVSERSEGQWKNLC